MDAYNEIFQTIFSWMLKAKLNHVLHTSNDKAERNIYSVIYFKFIFVCFVLLCLDMNIFLWSKKI